MKALKTGHIRVSLDFICNLNDAKDIDFWRQNIDIGKAIFLEYSFSVETTSTSRLVHVNTTYKNNSAYKNPKRYLNLNEGSFSCAIIEVYENGYLGFDKYEDEILYPHKTNVYQVLPFEVDKNNVSEQQKIIYEYDNVLEPVFIIPDFYPLHVIKY